MKAKWCPLTFIVWTKKTKTFKVFSDSQKNISRIGLEQHEDEYMSQFLEELLYLLNSALL